MATRFRLTATATDPAVTPALQSYSHSTPADVYRQLLTSDASALGNTAYAPDGADHLVAGDALIVSYVSAPIVAGIAFNNGDTIKTCIQGLEANAANNLRLQLWVGIYDSAGTTLQRTLRTKMNHATEWGTTLGSRFLTTTQDGANYTTAAGDRLVVEFSSVGTPTASGGTQGHNWTMRTGSDGAGGDLAEDDTQTGTTLNPWIEFAPSDLFVIARTVTGTQPAASGTLTRTLGAVRSLAGTQPSLVPVEYASTTTTYADLNTYYTGRSPGVLTADSDAVTRTVAGSQPAASGTLARVLAALRSLAGAQPSATGTLARRLDALRSLAGSQPASSGTLSAAITLLRAVSGSQPAATGTLAYIRAYLRPLAGSQPAPTGTLARLLTAFRSVSGSQPAATGTLVRSAGRARSLAGVQPAATGTLAYQLTPTRTVAGVQPAATGTLARLFATTRLIAGTQPAAAGTLTAVSSTQANEPGAVAGGVVLTGGTAGGTVLIGGFEGGTVTAGGGVRGGVGP